MSDRGRTALIFGVTSLFIFSPLAMSIFWRPIPLFQNFGFTRGSIAPLLAWILATIVATAYVFYTMKVIPFVLAKQIEISWFKLLGILAALIGGIVEEVFFRRWLLDMLISRNVAPIFQVFISGNTFGLAHSSWLLIKRDFKFAIPAMLSTSVLGILLAIIYLLGRAQFGTLYFCAHNDQYHHRTVADAVFRFR